VVEIEHLVRIDDQTPCNRSACRPGGAGDDRNAGCGNPSIGFYTRDRLIRVSGEGKMIKTIILSMCLAASSLSLDARAPDTLTRDALTQNDRQYTDGPVTEVDYIQVEYGHFPEYIDWLNSTWKPTMEAMKKAGIIIDYKVFQASPKSPDQPNMFLYLTYKNMAAYGGNIGDKGIEQEYVARKVIGSTEFQNKKRVERSAYRKVLGIELIREIMLR
jgi:L-rhamnose mutarotase